MMISPIRVPISPYAGAYLPMASNIALPCGWRFGDGLELVLHDLLDDFRVGAVHRHLDALDDERIFHVLGHVFEGEDAVAAGDFGVSDQIVDQTCGGLLLMKPQNLEDLAASAGRLSGKLISTDAIAPPPTMRVACSEAKTPA